MKKKLLLIQPVSPAMNYFSREGAIFPPLGLAYLAAMAPQDEWEVEIVTENKEKFRYQAADLVGISAFSANMDRAYAIAKLYESKNIPVVMGGCHVSAVPEEALKYCSSVVIGEAEKVWPKVLQDFMQGNLQRVYRGEQPDLAQGGNVLPRHGVYSQKYRYSWAMVQTTRGCPLHCDFCSVRALYGSSFRARPVDEVLDEIATIPQKYLMFCDVVFGGSTAEHTGKAIEFLQKMYERGIKKQWACYATLDSAFDQSLLTWMQKTGCIMFFMKFEAPLTKDLAQQTAEFDRAVENVHRYGITIMGSFILGGAKQTYDHAHELITFAYRSKIDVPLFVFPSIYPGTELWKSYEPKFKYHTFPEDYLIMSSGFFCGFEHDSITEAQWIKIRQEVFGIGYPWGRVFKAAAYWLKRRHLTNAMNTFFINLGYRIMYQRVMKCGNAGDAGIAAAVQKLKAKEKTIDNPLKIMDLYAKLVSLIKS